MNTPTALALTALENFWPQGGNLLFLGRWCLLPARKSAWENLDREVLPYPWDDRHRMRRASAYCRALSDRLLAAISGSLAKIHDPEINESYCRILLDSWLKRFTDAFCDRYVCLEDALEKYPNLVTIGLEEHSFVTPFSFRDFERLYSDDAYNLQLFTEIGAHLGVAFSKRLPLAMSAMEKASGGSPAKRVLRGGYDLFNQAAFALTRDRVPVWLMGLYAPPAMQFKISKAARGTARSYDLGFLDKQAHAVCADLKPNLELREKFLTGGLSEFEPKDPFANLLARAIARHMPTVYLEGFSRMVELVRPFLAKTPKALVTAVGVRGSLAYPFLAADAAAKGAKHVSVQHGGSFGTVELSPMEVCDQEVSDEYWSWGWENGLAKKTTPMPALILEKTKLLAQTSAKPAGPYKTLYCGNTMPRYQIFFWSNPLGPQWEFSIEWQHRWLATLSPESKRGLLLRMCPGDEAYGWMQKNRIAERFPDLRFDDRSETMEARFREYDVIVADSNHTVFLQSFVMDKPTVIFWDPGLNELRPAAVPDFLKLKEAGILHDSPEAAAEALNRIIADPYAWWREPARQVAVIRFCEKYAHCSEDWLKIWTDRLRVLAE